jgi:MerR family transcriptional regulator/heat shock protein HspR
MKPAGHNYNYGGRIQLFEPDPGIVYNLEEAAHIGHVPRHAILVYYKHGLISSVSDPDSCGYYFNEATIRTIRQIGYLQTVCGVNLDGVRVILNLMKEVERLREEVRESRG